MYCAVGECDHLFHSLGIEVRMYAIAFDTSCTCKDLEFVVNYPYTLYYTLSSLWIVRVVRLQTLILPSQSRYYSSLDNPRGLIFFALQN